MRKVEEFRELVESKGRVLNALMKQGEVPRAWALEELTLLQYAYENLSPKHLVEEFHREARHPIAFTPTLELSEEEINLRLRLIREEWEELQDAVKAKDLVKIADALGDLVYVIYGFSITLGIPLDAVLREIHRSNMTKFPAIYDEEGKVQKRSTYEPPDIKKVLENA